MILKGSQRGGAVALADHLLNERDNDHVSVMEVRGCVARNLHGAFMEAHAISKGTHCTQFLFSLSLSPPIQANVSEQDLLDAVERAEGALGLDGQPRAIVFHEKEGRRHAHAVWSRIDAKTMTAINLPHFKNRLMTLSRDLYLEHGWELPQGLRRDGGKSPLNFTLAEWQQAKRLKLDPREIKQSFQEAWKRSDSLKAFAHALEDRGYFLAKGDRRGFVALNIDGEVFSVPRMLSLKTKEVKARLGDPDHFPSVDETKQTIAKKVTTHIRHYIDQVDHKHEADFAPLKQERTAMVEAHRQERQTLHNKQQQRWAAETKTRQDRFNRGLKAIWDRIAGRAKQIRQQNEIEAWDAAKRDQRQRDALVMAQMTDRRELQDRITALRRQHARDRNILARDIARSMRMANRQSEFDDREQERVRDQQHLHQTRNSPYRGFSP